jgi:hypothetical protein
MMPNPNHCIECDKPIIQSENRKYQQVHDKCMMDYLDKINNTKEDKSD